MPQPNPRGERALTLLLAVGAAVVVACTIVAIVIIVGASGFNDGARRSQINLCEGGNLTRAYLRSTVRVGADNPRSDPALTQAAIVADALFPIRDCTATTEQGKDVIVPDPVSDRFLDLVRRYRPGGPTPTVSAATGR